MGPALRRVIGTKVHALGQIWAKARTGQSQTVQIGRNTKDRQAGGSKEFLSEKGRAKSAENRSRDVPRAAEIVPKSVSGLSLGVLGPKGRPRGLPRHSRGSLGALPGLAWGG